MEIVETIRIEHIINVSSFISIAKQKILCQHREEQADRRICIDVN